MNGIPNPFGFLNPNLPISPTQLQTQSLAQQIDPTQQLMALDMGSQNLIMDNFFNPYFRRHAQQNGFGQSNVFGQSNGFGQFNGFGSPNFTMQSVMYQNPYLFLLQ